MWYESLRFLKSRGSQVERPGSLAGLASARKQHLGQFFTPAELAALMWKLAVPAMEQALEERKGSKVSVLDNSVGSGRLLQYADPAKHTLWGVDVDAEPLAALGQKAEEVGFDCTFERCGMEAIHPEGFDVALINPPFSVHLETASLVPYPCTSYGRYGPSTSTVSHAYALAQAVEAAQVTVALLPRAFAEEVAADPGAVLLDETRGTLRAVIHLPPKMFREEGTDVRVSLLVFNHGRPAAAVVELAMKTLDDRLPDLALRIGGQRKPRLRVQGVTDSGPAITLPVTGDRAVRVVRDGRRLSLRYRCGLVMAKVENALLRCRVEPVLGPEQRFPKGVRFEGQGVMDLEVHLAQEDPLESFDQLVGRIRAAGGEPDVDPGIRNYLRRASRRTARQTTPMRHTVFVQDGVAGDATHLTGVARRPQVADPKVWGSPAIAVGQEVAFLRGGDGRYRFSIKGKEYELTAEDLYERFEVRQGAAAAGWKVVHQGLLQAYPEHAQALEKRARQLGIDSWLSWGYQWDDCIELSMKRSAVVAWEMGLGKARLAVALILLNGCRHGLIATEAGLVPEMVVELKGLPIPADSWQVITEPRQLNDLKVINVISYERLRQAVDAGQGSTGKVKRMRKTYAGYLRRRIGVAVFDEGDLLANPSSDQARACAHVSAKRRYVLSATPMANYPRDIAPILAFTAGDGTATQPWGWRRGKLQPQWIESMNIAERGIDAFRDTFVSLAWATKEFSESLAKGAKREIPRIANVEAYRQMLAPHVKRRIVEEPEVAAHIRIPEAVREVVEVPWDHAHFAYYLKVVDEFSNYYQQAREAGGKANNLVAILARIRAVGFASNYPQHGVEGFGAYGPLTSKQRWVLDQVARLAQEGKKTVVYVENPGLVELLQRKLAERGIEAVGFHGGKSIKTRTKELNARFRFGDCKVLLATLATTQKGLNLYCASHVIFLGRSWSAATEEQAIARLLRPQQKQTVHVKFVHLRGAICGYQAQLVAFKRDAAACGLDWGTPETADADFLHMDTVIERFVADVARLHQVARGDVRRLMENLSKGLEYDQA